MRGAANTFAQCTHACGSVCVEARGEATAAARLAVCGARLAKHAFAEGVT